MAAQENRILTRFLDNFTELNVRMRGFGIYWRASVASETLTGVTQSKIGDVCLLASERSERDSIRGGQCKIGYMLLASERSERDTYRGNTIENRGCLFIYLFICIYVWTYVCN